MNDDVTVAFITAGANGIGKCIAETFLKEGHNVHICDNDEQAINQFLDSNPSATASIADVSDITQVKKAFDDLKRHYERLDILINNAGISGDSALTEEIAIESWQKTIDVNLNGMFYVSKLAIPLLKENNGGSIVNMSSTAGLLGVPIRSPYVASKWAIIGLTKTWAMELGPYGIRVNAICPGCVDGERIKRVIDADAKKQGKSPQQIKDVYLRQSSMRQFVEGQDIANMVSYLCSEKGSKISGQAIAVDGHTEGLFNWLD